MALPIRPSLVLRQFMASEASGGLTLMFAAGLALLLANSPLAWLYFDGLAAHPLGIGIHEAVNDGLMALFFLLVGLEIKRELIEGELATWPKRLLPGIAALGGMMVPAIIYLAVNVGSPATLRGWAIPAATDIAFSLAVLTLLGSRATQSLMVFLTALAILDDLGAIIIIALFYAGELSPLMLGLDAVTFAALVALNRLRVGHLLPYLVLGCLLWFFVLKSGLHATIAGVLLALVIPLSVPARNGKPSSPLLRLEGALHPWVIYGVLPIFGFVNAGLSFGGLSVSAVLHPVTLGIALGLFFGKQIGIFGSVWLAARLGLAQLPRNTSTIQVYGMALLCGIGFTMSLFIGLLAFADAPQFEDMTKLGVLAGSLVSALLGWLVLRLASPQQQGAARRRRIGTPPEP
jgi:NhaA family Na+:H+ antiporter